jgi:beta-lactamase regulating signal transducer with metallopeptidase domain
MMQLLIEAALRSLVVAFAVGLVLKLCRVRHAQVEATAWTVVLAAGLAMPLLMQLTLLRLPTSVVMLPHQIIATAVPALPLRHLSAATHAMPSGETWSILDLVPFVYGAIAAVLLLRLAAGLVMTWRIVRTARPIRADWTRGADVRITARVAAPVTFGRTILVPVSFITWPDAKRRAVMGHEGAHVANHDFTIQLLSQLHSAVFWFSPLAWWLQRRLAALAETTSDEAAILKVGSRLDYAEILLDIAAGVRNRGRRDPSARGLSAGIAMARPALLHERVDHILCETGPLMLLAPSRRLLLAASLVPGILLVGGLSWHARAADIAAFAHLPIAAIPAIPAIPPVPAIPAMPAAAADGGAPFVIQLSGRHTMASGDGSELERLLTARDKVDGEAILFLHDGKVYDIADPALVEQAADLFRPENDLAEQERSLSEQQSDLGQQQSEIGREQGEIGRQMGELGRREGERMAAIATRVSLSRDDADEARADAEQEFKEQMAELAQQQKDLGKAQGRLSAAQAKLSAAHSRIGEAQSRLAHESDARMRRLLDRALADGMAKPLA